MNLAKRGAPASMSLRPQSPPLCAIVNSNDDATAAVTPPRAPETRGSLFPATRWSVVFRARQEGQPGAAQALGELCKIYWKPVYAFLRRQGNTPHDAEDLTQGFFAMLLERGSLATVEESGGRLRTFLLCVLKRFAANEHARSTAQKRGGRAVHVPIDADDAENSCFVEPATGVTPETLFERQWALTLLDAVLAKLSTEFAKDGKSRIFDALKDRVSADGDPETLARTAAALGMSEGAVKVTVFRMRQRYRRILHEEIAQTVDSPQEVAAEIAHLFKVFGQNKR